ncbi:MAG: hypothetical protein H7X93_13255 [Sphingomonadaceae bacterium]|nr:hypothetical protein [Sphingomonadaceae bacterium]
MRLALVLLATLAVPLAALMPDPAEAQARSRSASIVAQALYAASATTAASERAADERASRQRARIGELTSQLAAARANDQSQTTEIERQADELAAQQEQYVADLADRDQQYARQIALYRATVTDVSATPEGLEALARFNAGDWAGAREILTRLTETIDRIEDMERAARYRSVAALYNEAFNRGQETVANVIAQYERVVALDDSNIADWQALRNAYINSGDAAKQRQAADRALALAADDRERASAMADVAIAANQQGDLAQAIAISEQSIAIARRLLAEAPASLEAQTDLAQQLRLAGVWRENAGQADEALALRREGLALYRALAAADADALDYPDGAIAMLIGIGEIEGGRGRYAEAEAALNEAVSIADAMLARNPEQRRPRRRRLGALYELGDLQFKQERWSEARASAQQVSDEYARLAELDPSSGSLRRDLAAIGVFIAQTWAGEGDHAQAEIMMRRSLAEFRALAEGDPTSWSLRDDIAYSSGTLGDSVLAQGRIAEAGLLYAEAETLARANVAANPADANALGLLVDLLPRLRGFAARTGDTTRVSALEAEIAALPQDESSENQ